MPEPCQGCALREVDFGGCRCQALRLLGDATATDPVCDLSPQHEVVTRLRERAGADRALVAAGFVPRPSR